MAATSEHLTDEELRKLHGKLTPEQIDALTDDEVRRLHAITSQAGSDLVGKQSLQEFEHQKAQPPAKEVPETPVVRLPQYPGQRPPLPRDEGPKDFKSFMQGVGRAAMSGADRQEPTPEIPEPPTAAEAEMNNPLLLGERIRKEQDKLIGASQPMAAYANTPPMEPQKAEMLTRIAGEAAYALVKGQTESIAQFVANPLAQAADHPVEFGLNLVAIAMPLAGSALKARSALEALPQVETGLGAIKGQIAGGAVGGALAGGEALYFNPKDKKGAVKSALLGAAAGAAGVQAFKEFDGFYNAMAEIDTNLKALPKLFRTQVDEIAATGGPGFAENFTGRAAGARVEETLAKAVPEIDRRKLGIERDQIQSLYDDIRASVGDEHKSANAKHDAIYDEIAARKDAGDITGPQESVLNRMAYERFIDDAAPSNPTDIEPPKFELMSPDDMDAKVAAIDKLMSEAHQNRATLPGDWQRVAKEAVASASPQEVAAANQAIDSQITKIDDLKTANRQLGGDPAISQQLRDSEATLAATQDAIDLARAEVEVPRFDPGEVVENSAGKTYRVQAVTGKVATVVDETGELSRVHVDSLKLGDIPPVAEEPLAAAGPVARQKGDTVTTPDGYTYEYVGEQPGAKGKPPIRFWKPDRQLPDGTNAKGVAVTDEAIRRNGLVHPDEVPARKTLGREEIDKYQKLVREGGKGYEEQKYPTSIKVRVTFEDGAIHEDSVKGLNEGHALARAAGNWPSAVKIESLGVESSAAELSTQTATAQGSIKLTDVLSTTPLGGILIAGAMKDDHLDPTPKHGSPLALKNALWAIPAGIFAYGVARWFAAPEFRLALKQFTRLDKAAPADLERVFETFLAPLFPDKPANDLQRLVPGVTIGGGALAGAFVGSKVGEDEPSPVGALLGAAAGAAMGGAGVESFSRIFRTNITYRQLYKMYFTEAAGMSASAVQAKYMTRVALEGRIQELKDVAEELDKFDDATNGAIQAWMSGNANISLVPKAAQAAANRARVLFDNLTTDLLKSGLIKDKILRDTMQSNMGTYVPRMFLRYELDDQPLEIVNSWLRGQGKGWGYLSSKNYLKAKKDLPPTVLKALGEIVDNPGYLLAKRGTVVAADIEQARYHRFLMASPENVIPGKFLRQQRKIATFQRAMRAGEEGVAAKPSLIKGAEGTLMNEPTQVRFFKGESGFEAAEWQGRTYWKMPDNPKYGLIRNQFVEQAVASDIMSTHETTTGLQRLFNAPLSMFKYFKAVMNPASQFRNMITNTIFADIEAGIAPWRMDKWAQGMQDLASKGPWYERARKAGVFGGQFTVSEIEGLLLPHAQRASSVPEFIGNTLNANANKPAQFFTKWHQSSEAWARMTTFRHGVESLGMTEAEAASFARRTIPDYQDVQRWVKVVRTSPFGAPFISFSYKAIPRSLEAAVAFGDPKKMMRFWKYPFAMAALNEYSAREHGLLGKDESTDLFGTLRRLTLRTLSVGTYNPDSYDTYRKYLPNYVGGMQIGVPWRDRFDRQKYLDGTFFLPWGDAGEMGKGDFAKGTGMRWFPRQLEPSNPWFQLGVAGATGKDSFTGRDIIPPGAVGMEATAAWGKFLMRAWGPSLLNPAGYGASAMQKSFGGQFDDDPNVKSRGTAVASEIFGMRTRPVDPASAQRFKAYDVLDELDKNRSEIMRLRRWMSPEDPLFKMNSKKVLAEHPDSALARAIRRRQALISEFKEKYPKAEIPKSPEKLIDAIKQSHRKKE